MKFFQKHLFIRLVKSDSLGSFTNPVKVIEAAKRQFKFFTPRPTFTLCDFSAPLPYKTPREFFNTFSQSDGPPDARADDTGKLKANNKAKLIESGVIHSLKSSFFPDIRSLEKLGTNETTILHLIHSFIHPAESLFIENLSYSKTDSICPARTLRQLKSLDIKFVFFIDQELPHFIENIIDLNFSLEPIYDWGDVDLEKKNDNLAA